MADTEFVFGCFLLPLEEFKMLERRWFVNLYLIHLKVCNYSVSYITSVKRTLRDYSDFLEQDGADWVDGVGRQTWRGFLAFLTEKGLSKRAIARRQSTLRMFYEYLKWRGITMRNPFSESPTLRYNRPSPQFLKIDEVKKVIESPDPTTVSGQRDRAMLELLYASGLRISELVNLDIQNIALGTGEVRLRGKGAKDRVALFGEPARQALQLYVNWSRSELLNGSTTPALFINHHGDRISKQGVEELVKRYGMESIGRKVHPHMFRHSFATHLLDGGAELEVIQQLLGHTHIETTQIYVHTAREHLRREYLKAHPLAQTSDKGGEHGKVT